jgi:Mn-dependent DtxR family transcriptional regulator
MERLQSKGYSSDPKAKSVALSEEGEKRPNELFVKHFALKR